MLLTERHSENITGEIGCYDRIIIQRNPGKHSYAGGMTSFSMSKDIRYLIL